jgi:hypothetical protein
METFRIIPTLGLKTNVPQNDPQLFQMVSENTAVVFAVGGENFDLRRTRNASTKSFGKSKWSSNPVPMATTGSNLIANGAAWTGATGATPPTGWGVVTAGLFAIFDSGDASPYDACLKISVDATPAEDPAITDAITTVIGKSYKLSYAFKHGTGTAGLVYIGTTSGGSEISDSGALTDASWTAHTYEFVATTTTIYITLTTDSATDGQYELFDTVTLYELAATSDCYCLGMKEITSGSTTHRWSFHGDDSSLGQAFRWDSSRYPVRLSSVAGHSGAVEFAYDTTDYYSILDYGGYMILADFAEHTPYCSDHNDAILTKLINTGTEYKAKYLESFQNHIIAANIDTGQVTNGDISIIWSNLLAAPGTDCTFGTGDPPANHLFRPNDDPITGIKKMGMNACFLYGENSIDRIDYYTNYRTPFGITNSVMGAGSVNSNSIIDAGGRHFLFDRKYGFCEYRGGIEFPFGGKPISDPIEKEIAAINPLYYPHISGKFLRQQQALVWVIPAGTSPDKMYFFDLVTGQWTIEDRPAWSIDTWTLASSTTWQDLVNLGYTTWESFGSLRWGDLVSETPRLVLSNDSGEVYFRGNEDDNGSDFNGYRIEPILDFGSAEDKDLLLEIWFGLSGGVADYNLYVHYRGGDTVGEVTNKGWTVLNEVSANSPSNAVVYLDELNRFHQLKWGTDAKNEMFEVNSIEFKYVRQGRY